MPATPNASFRSHATAFRKYPSHSLPRLANPMDCPERLRVLHRISVARKPAQATPTMISKAWACLRTSISVRRSDARTNTRADLMASCPCIFASLAQAISQLLRTQQRKRQKQLMKSASSLSTSAVKLHARFNRNAALPTTDSPSNLVVVGRKLDRIYPYEAVGRRQSGNTGRNLIWNKKAELPLSKTN
jgi:hypothetical protein